jgi:xanthine dehydrogenase small subunit
MHTPLHFIQGGKPVTLANVAPQRMLLEVLREDLGCSAVKEGCRSGDCGACTVAVADAHQGALRWRAINSCIRPAHAVDGMAVFTAQDIAGPQGELHPCQQAMVDCHASQCGFCTPGFVMSLFAAYQHSAGKPMDREQAVQVLSGNLCRCTGYRPILDAATQMHTLAPSLVDEEHLLSKIELTNKQNRRLPADLTPEMPFYARPGTLPELLQLKAAQPQAQLVAGATDVGLWITKLQKHCAQIIDLTRVAELLRIDHSATQLRIGAAANLVDAFAAICAQRPQLSNWCSRFAGLPIRYSATLGGNIANGSPIGDAMPLLIALGASVVLASVRGERSLALEDLYTGYRQTLIAADEVVAYIDIPNPSPTEFTRAYKISKRFEDDISAVCVAVKLEMKGEHIQSARIGCGGVAAMPVRAIKTEAALAGNSPASSLFDAANHILQAEFTPISDMRASAGYRREVLGNLLLRLGHELRGEALTNLEHISAEVLV